MNSVAESLLSLYVTPDRVRVGTRVVTAACGKCVEQALAKVLIPICEHVVVKCQPLVKDLQKGRRSLEGWQMKGSGDALVTIACVAPNAPAQNGHHTCVCMRTALSGTGWQSAHLWILTIFVVEVEC